MNGDGYFSPQTLVSSRFIARAWLESCPVTLRSVHFAWTFMIQAGRVGVQVAISTSLADAPPALPVPSASFGRESMVAPGIL